MSYTVSRHIKQIKINTTEDIEVQISSYASYENLNLEFNDTVTDSYIFDMADDTAYQVLVTNSSNVTEEYTLFHYTELIKNLSKEFKNFLCNIKDISCNQCNQDDLFQLYNYQLSLKTKLLYLQKSLLRFYSASEVEAFNSFVYYALNSGSCKIKDYYTKLIKEECDLGYASDKEIYRIFISVYYLGLYFLDSNNNLNDFEEDEEGNIINYFKGLYQIEKVKDCLCSTCLDFDELKKIFEDGIPTPSFPGILPEYPISGGVYMSINSYTSNFISPFSFSLFNNPYTGNTSSEIKGIKITTPFSTASLILNNDCSLGTKGDVLTQLNLEISKINIDNVSVSATSSSTSIEHDSLGFKVFDGSQYSKEYTLKLHLVKDINRPPSILNSLDLNTGSETYITKQELLSSNLVEDVENDDIDFIKLTSFTDVDVKYNSSNSFITLPLNFELDLKTYNLYDNVLKLETSSDKSILKIAYKDSLGSNSFSNANNANNVLNINLNKLVDLQLIFSLNAFINKSSKNYLTGLGRVKIPKSLTTNLSLVSSDVNITNLSLAPANNAFYADFNITPPAVQNNEYDIIGQTTYDDNNEFVINVNPFQNVPGLNVTGSIKLNTIASNRNYDIFILDTNQINASYFSYLDGSNNLKPFTDFYNNGSFVDPYIQSVISKDISQVVENTTYSFNNTGVIIFAIKNISEVACDNIKIYDVVGDEVRDIFNFYYNPLNNMCILVSKYNYSKQEIVFKFKF